MTDELERLIEVWEKDGAGVAADAAERAFLLALSGNVPHGPAHAARILLAAAELAEAHSIHLAMQALARGPFDPEMLVCTEKLVKDEAGRAFEAYEMAFNEYQHAKQEARDGR